MKNNNYIRTIVVFCLMIGIFSSCGPSTPTPTAEISRSVTQIPSISVSPTYTSTITATTVKGTDIPTAEPFPYLWEQQGLAQDFPRDYVTALYLDEDNENNMYLDTKHAGYYESRDGGQSWQPMRHGDISSEIIALLDASRETNSYSHTDIFGKERLYQFDGFWFVSEDDGDSWVRFTQGGVYRSQSMVFTNDDYFYIYCGRNICKVSADTKSIAVLGIPDVGLDSILVISANDSETIYATGEGVAISKDGGYHWTKLNAGLGSTLTSLEFENDGNSLYLMVGECLKHYSRSVYGQDLYYSIDDGLTWKYVERNGCFLIKDANPDYMYRLATNADNYDPWIWQMTTKGHQWYKINIPTAITTLITDPVLEGVLFAYDDIGPDVNQYRSTNRGWTWEEVNYQSAKPCYGDATHALDSYKPMAIDQNDSFHVFFVANNNLYESSNGCKTNSKKIHIPEIEKLNTVAYDGVNSRLYLGTNLGAFISNDHGVTWQEINEGLLDSPVVYSIIINTEQNVFASTPYGVYLLVGK